MSLGQADTQLRHCAAALHTQQHCAGPSPMPPRNGQYEYQEQKLQKYLNNRYVDNNCCCRHFAPPLPECGCWGNYDEDTKGWCRWSQGAPSRGTAWCCRLELGTMSVNSLVPAAKCTHPRAVKVVLRETPDSARSGEHWPWLLTQREYMVTPELNLPKPPAIAGGANLWKATSWAHLFWVIPRDDSEEKWNCELFSLR